MNWFKQWLFKDRDGFTCNNNKLSVSIESIPACSILLTHDRTLLGSAIRLTEERLDRSSIARWNHSGLYLGGDKHETIEAMPDGVKVCRLEDSMVETCSFEVWKYAALTVTQASAIMDKAKSLVGDKYSYFDLTRLFIRAFMPVKIGRPPQGQEICSEVVSIAWRASGLQWIDKDNYDVTPDDIGDFITRNQHLWVKVASWRC